MLIIIITLIVTVGVAAHFLAFKPDSAPEMINETDQTEVKEGESTGGQAKTEKPTDKPVEESVTSTEQATANDSNKGYLVMKHWELRFKIPQGLAGIQYRIQGETAYLYGKPSSPKVEYRNDYDADKQGKYSLGYLKRSREASLSNDWGNVTGKKVGDYYYYTGHSFSGLESGVGFNGIFYTPYCDNKAKDNTDYNDDTCQDLMEAESKTFSLINGDEESTGLLPSIELLP